ncbi:hypothetical protein pclt_cds_570 [Pandoravirus celtis]|uniref:Uncharacterized protein n=1 Tax=Pandoravirus celtis TaxID=2568002 RepID=A0A4D6EIL3_9VIRU|nr:hypothetical protein pclt_cds_570 [Pandoravirus celtis]
MDAPARPSLGNRSRSPQRAWLPSPSSPLLHARHKKGDVHPDGLPVVAYEETVPDDIQYAIMRRLLTNDPRAALALAATSRHHASLLEAAHDPLARTSALVPVAAQAPAAADYVRASLAMREHALGRRADTSLVSPLISATAATQNALGIALCLVEAFVRFLLADPDSADERMPFLGGAAAGDVVDGEDLVTRVTARLHADTPLDRLAAWYEWVITPYRDLFATQPPGQVAWLIETDPFVSGSDGHFDHDTVDQHRRLLGNPHRCMAVGPIDHEGVGYPTTLFVFHGKSGARRLSDLLGRVVSPENLWSWSMHAHAPDAEGDLSNDPHDGLTDDDKKDDPHDDLYDDLYESLESPEALSALLRGIDEGVRQKARGRCGDPANTGRLALPPFTSLFQVTNPCIVVAAPGTLALAANARSPAIESRLV